jgi:hypothetical protein
LGLHVSPLRQIHVGIQEKGETFSNTTSIELGLSGHRRKGKTDVHCMRVRRKGKNVAEY